MIFMIFMDFLERVDETRVFTIGKACKNYKLRRGARVVEWDGFENRCTRKSTQGSNPCLAAIFQLEQKLN